MSSLAGVLLEAVFRQDLPEYLEKLFLSHLAIAVLICLVQELLDVSIGHLLLRPWASIRKCVADNLADFL